VTAAASLAAMRAHLAAVVEPDLPACRLGDRGRVVHERGSGSFIGILQTTPLA
jgi:hypothetical protein